MTSIKFAPYFGAQKCTIYFGTEICTLYFAVVVVDSSDLLACDTTKLSIKSQGKLYFGTEVAGDLSSDSV